jgi:hypothetical protein
MPDKLCKYLNLCIKHIKPNETAQKVFGLYL